MIWTVNYTIDAHQDLQGIYDYIADILLDPVTAAKQTTRIMDASGTLESMPFRCRLYDKEPWRSKGLRILPVDNYLVFYLPDESSNTIAVIRIMYKGRDVDRRLNEIED
jgi:toxin ParE1/3/4